MEGEINLNTILENLNPVLNDGKYVFTKVDSLDQIPFSKILFLFKEKEGITIVLEKRFAEELNLKFSYIASWITLEVHSALAAVGLTAAFSQALGNANISCNVVAAYLHDHIFVDEKDAFKAMDVLLKLKQENKNS
ncbi:ACT domain-containing protein [Flavobacterium sp. KACC 22763]|uniref:ACT domain-containing protein n=1 Tax=Flavobacterium sp. KACC 22763 TaxID=3025668 RepID=UPI002365A3A4|nr:ACT domain-containing protein [Flavobacterium sp. KACC 22763]WDF62716.1 ACT domain-containing protein [Flavobacterium sp. KACC 22763]